MMRYLCHDEVSVTMRYLCHDEVSVQALKGHVKAGTVNCDEHDWLCQQAGVGSYPSLRFYNGESEVR